MKKMILLLSLAFFLAAGITANTTATAADAEKAQISLIDAHNSGDDLSLLNPDDQEKKTKKSKKGDKKETCNEKKCDSKKCNEAKCNEGKCADKKATTGCCSKAKSCDEKDKK